ncbi:MAG: PASTA domain-containing protein [Flavobacteriaceae bacterium]|nr:PASTA domain-containing protein [Flavobacteriaceae bacterium]MCY4267345.1 PASTA domain-containing protein [Flavobacteriaceae bacterium]
MQTVRRVILFFVRHLFIAASIIIVLFWGINYSLKQYTRHNQFQIVPDLNGLLFKQAIKELKSQELRFQVIDSSQFFQELPPYSVIDQIPKKNSKVKKNRLIYLTINRSRQPLVALPELVQVTLRNATSIINAAGLEIGDTTYIDNIGQDMILKVNYQDQEVSSGFRLPKGSAIDLVLGNGRQ